MPEKSADEPLGTLGAMAAGLSTKDEKNLSALDRFGPLVAILAYLAIIFLMAFEVVPNPGAFAVLLGLLGPFVGAWAAKLGAS